MIFILVILLLINLFICYNNFKYLISPPFVMNIGLLGASIVAALNYNNWGLDTFSEKTVFVVGGGAIWFTFCCILFSGKNKVRLKTHFKKEINFNNVNTKRIKTFLFLLIGLGFLTILVRIKVYASFFGSNLNVASLIWSVRENATVGSREFVLPLFVKIPSIINSLVSYFTVWLLALQLHSKRRDKQLTLLFFSHIFVVCLDSILGGAKGGLVDLLSRFLFFYILIYYYKQQSIIFPRSLFYKLVILFCVCVLGFKSLNTMMGRPVEDEKSVDLFSIYCGAEIKNLDTYLQNTVNYGKSKYWGGTTFNNFYAYIGKTDNDYGAIWEYYDGQMLGNVYTQFYPFHRDWGIIGVFLILILISLIVMFFYKKSIEKLFDNPIIPSVYFVLYSAMYSHLFMSFFSIRFTEFTFHPGFLKLIIYVLIMRRLYISFFIRKKYD